MFRRIQRSNGAQVLVFLGEPDGITMSRSRVKVEEKEFLRRHRRIGLDFPCLIEFSATAVLREKLKRY